MRIVGIDPGTIRMGVGIIETSSKKVQLIHAETIKARAHQPLPERLKFIFDALSEVFQIFRPEQFAVENVFFSKDAKAAIKIGEARAIAMLVASQHSIPISEYAPTKVKQAVCGNGRAGKNQVQFMIRSLLELKQTPLPDTADALAIAFCHYQNHQMKSLRESKEVVLNLK